MPLVEVVRGRAEPRGGHPARLRGHGETGQVSAVVKSSPGFLVNRVLAPYLFAAMKAFEHGAPPEKIDAAAEHFGMFMGPAEVADNVGLDVCHHVAQVLGYPEEQGKAALDLVRQGKLGKKSGEGIYKWVKGKPVKRKMRFKPEELEALGRELVAPLIAECEKCVAEGIVESADLADAGIVFGTGFAPFRGGPMNHARKQANGSAATRVQAAVTEMHVVLAAGAA